MIPISVLSCKDEGYVKCPRCWKHHACLDNFNSICDRCCLVLVKEFPTHESVKGIIESFKLQEIKYRVKV